MSDFARRVAEVTGVGMSRIERLAGGDLAEILLISWPDGRRSVAKAGPDVGIEASMLRALGGAGVKVPTLESESETMLLLEYVPNDRVFNAHAWSSLGEALAHLHAVHGEHYGWPADYAHGSVLLDNREQENWPDFWANQRLSSVAALLDRPWRDRVDRLAERLGSLLPAAPRPTLLHGDLWSGNILVEAGRLAAFIDPACYYGHAEVDLAMLTLFDTPPTCFWEAYGALEPGWETRRTLYQLFPALVHLRLFGSGYAALVNRLLVAAEG